MMTLSRSTLIVPFMAMALLSACAPVTADSNGTPPHGGLDMSTGPVGGNGGGGGGIGGGGGDMAAVQACLVTCQSLGATCGIQGDGCGGQLDCGSCTAPATCGGAGTLNTCGNPSSGGPGGVCVPKTCAQLGFSCGPAGDGCGNKLDCWPSGTTSCPNPGDICGGGGMPGVCGGGAGSGGGCTGPLCPATCPVGQTTTIEGYVYAPTPPAFGTPDPLAARARVHPDQVARAVAGRRQLHAVHAGVGRSRRVHHQRRYRPLRLDRHAGRRRQDHPARRAARQVAPRGRPLGRHHRLRGQQAHQHRRHATAAQAGRRHRRRHSQDRRRHRRLRLDRVHAAEDGHRHQRVHQPERDAAASTSTTTRPTAAARTSTARRPIRRRC